MKIKLLSDLHLEFHKDNGKSFIQSLNNDCDVLVVAGDLTTHYNISESLSMLCDRFKEVVYVLGNHEFWGSSIDETINETTNTASKLNNLHFLNDSHCTIMGQRFIGGTMWFPSNPTANHLKNDWSDFLKIKDSRRIFLDNYHTVEFLTKEVKKNDIVVSHYLPSFMSVHPFYEKEASNCFFVCDMENVINTKEPSYWLHGHTHESMNYTIHATKVLCNPFGYLGYQTNKNFEDISFSL